MRRASLENVQPDARSVVTVGIFDGVHRGHQAILRFVQATAARLGGSSTVVTFDPHPREVTRDHRVPLLTTVEERADALQSLGIDRMVVIPFTHEFAQLSPDEFLGEILLKRVGMQAIVIGHDHGFGRGRAGDHSFLEEAGWRLGFGVEVIPAQTVREHVVSSTEIRTLLVEQGDVRGAREMLGRPYELTGTVVAGDRRGRTIGFPTANLQPVHDRKVIPMKGVYAVRCEVEGEEPSVLYAGMMNIGERPTFNGRELRLEVHLLGFSGDLYGRRLRVQFVQRLREERRFDSVDALVQQLEADRERCKAELAELF